MSVTFAIRFASGRRLDQVMDAAGHDRPGCDYNYMSTLGRGSDILGRLADGAGVDLWQFCYEDPSEFEDALEYLDLSSDRIAKRRKELAEQTQWHPIPEGLAVFHAIITYAQEHPDVIDNGWYDPLIAALETVVRAMGLALAQNEPGFHFSIG